MGTPIQPGPTQPGPIQPGPMRRGPARRGWRALCRSGRGVAALEFALTLPALIFLLFGMYDLSMGWITRRRLETAVTAVGQIASMSAVQPDTTNWLTTAQGWQAATAINAAMPETRATDSQYAVVMSEVYFTGDGCGLDPDNPSAGCVAMVLWSKVVLSNGVATLATRPCARALDQLANTSPPVQTGLPASAFQASPILVVDVAYTYTPLFLKSLFGTFPMRWMAYFPSRAGIDNVTQAVGYGDGVDLQGKKLIDESSYCRPLPGFVTSAL